MSAWNSTSRGSASPATSVSSRSIWPVNSCSYNRTTWFRSPRLPCRCSRAPTTSSCGSATRVRPRTTTARRSGSTSSRMPDPRPASAIAPATSSQQGKVRLVLTAPLQPEGDVADHLRLHGDGVRTIALRVEDATAAYEAATARGARSVAEPSRAEDEHGSRDLGLDRHLRRHHPHLCRARRVFGRLLARVPRRQPKRRRCRPALHRPHRRQRRHRQDGRLDLVLLRGVRIHRLPGVRREGHRHPVQRAALEGRARSADPDHHADQRAVRRAQEVADPGVPRLLPGQRHPAHRHPHR